MAQVERRLFIIGASGFLGGWVARAAERQFEVVRGSREGGDVAIDVAAAASVAAAFERARADCAVMLAALSDIDACEREPALAEAVNVGGVELVAEACRRRGTRLLFLSSAAVFDGERIGYAETDPVSPLSVYGQTKARAEALVADLLPDSATVRIALALGLAPEGRSNSLVNRLRSSFRAGRAVSMPAGECRNPIDAGRLAETIVWLAAHPEAHGLFHVGARDPVSRYELARRLAARMGFAPELVQREHERPDGRAPRGRHHFLKPDRLAALQPLPVPSTDDVIERSIDASA